MSRSRYKRDMGHEHHHHNHSHDHAHSHAPKVTGDNKSRVGFVLLLTLTFMLVEVVGGWLSGSLALLADAGHMLTDAAALALSWFAFYMSERPSDAKRSYGYHRAQILAAFLNALALFAIGLWIVVEAIGRFLSPQPVMGSLLLGVAFVGLLVNIAGFWILSRGDKGNLNMKGASLHIVGDMLGSVAAIIAGLVILKTGWMPIDPILSVFVAVLVLRSAWALLANSTHILLEGTPEGLDAARIGAALSHLPHVKDIHHVHAWCLTDEKPMVTLHAVLEEGADHTEALSKMQALLKKKFNVAHATIQIEKDGGVCHEN
ncbi:MAG: cation diffusion facilitator family transporter [Pseudobdellovibrionaceae bacterium]